MKIRFACCVLLVSLAGCGDVVRSTADASSCPGTTCECTVVTEVTDCKAHEVCDVSDGSNRVCKCAAGYVEGSDGACAFGTAPVDPGFQDPTKWNAVGMGPVVDPAATGSAQPGELILDKTSLCNFSEVKQMFTMPPFDKAEPLKVTITTTIVDPDGFLFTAPIQVSIGKQFVEVPAQRGVYKTTSACLGPAAFGGPVEIRVGSAVTVPCASAVTSTVRVDELKIEPAAEGECPKQAGIVNGSFQLATGWNFIATASGTGQILANIGENNSFAAQLQQPNRCSEIKAVGTLAVPTEDAVPHPALDLYWNGSSGARLLVSFADKGIGTLNANGIVKHSRICLPKWAVGNTNTLAFLGQRLSNNNCTVLNRTFILDNMTIVDEPACGELADVTDPNFERIANPNGPATGWRLLNGYVNDVEGGRVNILNSSANAKNGVGVLQSTNSDQCVSVQDFGAEIGLVVPPSSGAQGPAIKFAAKSDPANTNSETRGSLFPATTIFKAVAETGVYTQNVLCIPPGLAGRLVAFRLMTGRVGGGGCGSAYFESGFFDEVSVGTDASCPTQ
jgi:hypothetical protein